MRNRIDKIFREKLKDSESDYSKELWANIEAEIFPKKSNRYSGLWLLSLGLLFLIPMYLLKDIYSSTNFDSNSSDTTIALNQNSVNPERVDVYGNDISYDNNESKFKNTTNINKTNADNIETNTSSIDNIFSNEKNTAEIETLDLGVEDKNRIVNIDAKLDIKDNVFRIITNSKNKKNSNILGTNSNVEITPSNVNNSNFISRLSPKLDYKQKPRVITTDYCEDKKLNPNKYYSEIYAGFGFAPKSYSSSLQDEFYKDIRKKSEAPGLSFDAGFRIGYQLTNDFLIESGFEYSQYNYSVAYKDGLMNSTVIVIDTIIIDGMELINIDTTIVQTYNEGHVRLKHQNLEIPLLLGKEFNINDRFSLAVKAGIALNIYSQSSGYILDSEEHLLNIGSDGTSLNNNYFKSSLGFSIPVQAQLYYKVTPEIDLFAKAGIRYYPNPITLDQFVIEDKISYNNIGVGLRVQI